MTRQLRSTFEKSLRPGWYLYWQQQTYQILSLHLDNLLVQVVNIATNETEDLSLDTLLINHEDNTTLLAAPSLVDLHQEIATHQQKIGEGKEITNN